MSKNKIGVALSSDVIAKLDEIIELSTDLKMTRSEIINAILKAFFASKANPIEKGREIVIRCRKGLL
jgi:metal-responsive CopG/Arc/MetJ family transcriptional regulator